MPYIIGVAGSVAVGKSTTARLLRALLARWPNVPKVNLVTTDGFLYPTVILEREGLMERKGFPESYDLPAVCTKNSILIDYVTESPNVSGDDCTALLLADPVRFAVQVEEPT
jgi:pantothenate kinase